MQIIKINYLLLVLCFIVVLPIAHSALNDGLTGFYDLEQNNWDSNNLTNNITVTSGGFTLNVTAKINTYSFNTSPSNGYLSSTIGKLKMNSTNFSISFWFNPNSTTTDSFLVECEVSNDCFRLSTGGTNKLTIGAGSAGSFTSSSASTQPLLNNKWQMITLTYDSLNLFRLYINGTADVTFSKASYRPLSYDICFGSQCGAAYDTKALYDGITTWDRTLSQYEITQLYNGGSGLTYNQLLGVSENNITFGLGTTNTTDFNSTTTINYNVTIDYVDNNLTTAELNFYNLTELFYTIRSPRSDLRALFPLNNTNYTSNTTSNNILNGVSGNLSGYVFNHGTRQGGQSGSYFNGSHGVITNNDFNLNEVTNGVTLIGWFNRPNNLHNTSDTNPDIISFRAGSLNIYAYTQNLSGSNINRCGVSFRINTTLTLRTIDSCFIPSTDNMFVSVWNTTHVLMYMNGVELGTAQTTTGIAINYTSWLSNYNMNIGKSRGGLTPTHFNGSIYNTLVYNKSLNSSEISAIYNAGKCAVSPVGDKLISQYILCNQSEMNAEGLSYAESQYSNSTTVYDTNNMVEGRSGKGSVAYNFNGVNNNVIIEQNSILNFSTSNKPITISGWMKSNRVSSTVIGTTDNQIILDVSGSSARFILNSLTNDRVSYNIQSNYLGLWKFYTGTYNGSDLKLYIDGVLVNTTNDGGGLYNTTANFEIGDGVTKANGSISDVAIWNRTLSDEEVVNVYLYGADSVDIIGNYTFAVDGDYFMNATATFSDGTTINTETREFLVDTIMPTITATPSFNNSYAFYNNITGQFNFSDTNLFSWNVSVDGVTYANETNVAYTDYSYNFSYDPRTLAVGGHTLSVVVSDGHTSQSLFNEYEVRKGGWFDDANLEFKTKTNLIAINPEIKDTADKFSYERVTDRYKFSYEPNEYSKDNTYSFIVTTEQPQYIVNKPESEYKTWIVSGTNWIDFVSKQINMNTLKIEPIDEYNSRVWFYSESKEPIQFDSIGDLNIVTYNYTFYTVNYTVSYSTPILEQTSNTVSVIVYSPETYLSYSNVSGYLTYNNTNYTFTKTSNLSAVILTTDVISPEVTTESSIPLNVTLNISSLLPVQLNYTQSVINFNIDNCSNTSWINALNISTFDEVTRANLTNTSIDFNLYVTTNGSDLHFGLQLRNRGNYSLCIYPNSSSYTINGDLVFYSNGYIQKEYYLHDFTLDNTTDQLNLFLLGSQASNISVTVYDIGGSEKITGAYIKYLRYYFPDNSYTLVGIEKTGESGSVYIPLEKYNSLYKFIVEYPIGTQMLETTPEYIISDNINLQLPLTQPFQSEFSKSVGIYSDLSYNNATNNFRATFNNKNSNFETVTLSVYKSTLNGKTLVGSNSLETAAGTLLVGITPLNDSTYTAILTVITDDGSNFILNTEEATFVNEAPFGTLGLFLIALLIIVCAFVAYFSISLMVMIIPIPLLLGSIMHIIQIPIGIIILLQVVAIILGLILRDR